MYTELNPFLWRWMIMAAVMAIASASIPLAVLGKALWRRSHARRAAVADVRPLHARRASARGPRPSTT